MKDFYRRLKFFMVGVFFGSILVYFTLFKDRERAKSTWLPNERVLNAIQKGLDNTDDSFLCKLSCCEMPLPDFEEKLAASIVNFDKSSQRTSPATYLLEVEKSKIKFEFSLESDVAKLLGIYPCFESKTCDCD